MKNKKWLIGLPLVALSASISTAYADFPYNQYSPARHYFGGTYSLEPCDATESYYFGMVTLTGLINSPESAGNTVPLAVPLLPMTRLEATCESGGFRPTDDAVAREIGQPVEAFCNNMGDWVNSWPAATLTGYQASCAESGAKIAGIVQQFIGDISPKPFVAYYTNWNGIQWKWFGNTIYYAGVTSYPVMMRSDNSLVNGGIAAMNWITPLLDTNYYPTNFLSGVNNPPISKVLAEGVTAVCEADLVGKHNIRHTKESTQVRFRQEEAIVSSCKLVFSESKQNELQIPFSEIGIAMQAGVHAVFSGDRYAYFDQGNKLSELETE